MKFCKKCHHLYNDENTSCENCKCSLTVIKDDNTSVFILSAFGLELERIKAALKDNSIPFETSAKKKNLSANSVTGYDIAEYDLRVPYSDYEKAYDVCVGIGAIKEEDTEISDEQAQPSDDAFENMSSTKRTFIRLISALLFIALLCAVVWGTDFITALIKSLL